MAIENDRWYWYRHKTWGWLEVKVLGPVPDVENVFRCFSPPTMVYLLNGSDLKVRRGDGKIYEHNPGKITRTGKPYTIHTPLGE